MLAIIRVLVIFSRRNNQEKTIINMSEVCPIILAKANFVTYAWPIIQHVSAINVPNIELEITLVITTLPLRAFNNFLESFKNKLIELTANREFAEEIGNNAYDYYLKEASIERMTEGFIKAING